MVNDIFILITALFIITKGATLATKYSTWLAESFHLSKYTVSFIIIAIISILPETFVAINSALEGKSYFGLGALLGSNIADLTLVFAIIIFFTNRNLKVESKIFKNHTIYHFLLILPLFFGFNGHFSRLEGVILIIVGVIFYYFTFKNGGNVKIISTDKSANKFKNYFMLILSMAILLIGAHFAVTSAVDLAGYLGFNPILIGMLIVGLGTTIPELFFALKSVDKKDDSLAIGDILGTVLADATIVVGILTVISPFYFPQRIIYVTGSFMVIASFLLFYFMKTNRVVTKKEAFLLFIFWLLFIFIEFILNL